MQIRSLNQDNRNTQNGHSLMKVAEGAVQSTVAILKTLKEKVINAANDTNTGADRMMIQKELDQSIDQINDNALVTYNEKYLLNGSKNGKSEGTFTALTNSSFKDGTSGGTALVNLQNRNGESLNIRSKIPFRCPMCMTGRRIRRVLPLQTARHWQRLSIRRNDLRRIKYLLMIPMTVSRQF